MYQRHYRHRHVAPTYRSRVATRYRPSLPSFGFKTGCLFAEHCTPRGSFVRPPFEICYDPFRVENRFSELDPKVFVLLFLFNDLPVFIYIRVHTYAHIHRIVRNFNTCLVYLYAQLFISNDFNRKNNSIIIINTFLLSFFFFFLLKSHSRINTRYVT